MSLFNKELTDNPGWVTSTAGYSQRGQTFFFAPMPKDKRWKRPTVNMRHCFQVSKETVMKDFNLIFLGQILELLAM